MRLRALLYAINHLDSAGQITSKEIQQFLKVPSRNRAMISHILKNFERDQIIILNKGIVSFTNEGISYINQFKAFVNNKSELCSISYQNEEIINKFLMESYKRNEAEIACIVDTAYAEHWNKQMLVDNIMSVIEINEEILLKEILYNENKKNERKI